MPNQLIKSPGCFDGTSRHDALSAILSTIRLSGSLQFCFIPSGHWQTDATPALSKRSGKSRGTMPFHVLVDGTCWLKTDDLTATLEAGDVVAFPFGTGHQLGAGAGGTIVVPTNDLPATPWREIPILRYGDGTTQVRMLCGYLQCEMLSFAPLMQALPKFIHIKSSRENIGGWLAATVQQMAREVEQPRAGSVAMLLRLTEILFIEILRHEITMAEPRTIGWLAAMADPSLSRCLSLIHEDPKREWSLHELASSSGMSRSALVDRFQATLGTSPIRYVRDWRLYLASVALATTDSSISTVAQEAGYDTDAAFNRAFVRAFGTPPATWRVAAAK